MSVARLELPEQGLIAPEKSLLQSRTSALPGNAMTDAFTIALSSDHWSAAPGRSGSSAQTASPLCFDLQSQGGAAFHNGASAPFVYTLECESDQASPFETSGYQLVTAAIADAAQDVFDGWINATLAANRDALVTRGAWS